MKVLKLCIVLLLLLSSTCRAQDTVAEDIGVHQLERLVMLLTSKECKDLVVLLSDSEQNVFQRLERLSPENNQLALKPLAKRALSTAAESQKQCRTALTDWLLKYGEEIYYDRLTRALQHIGRTDVAIEVGKNINQDKSLSLKRYVEDYHKFVSSFKVPQLQPETNNAQRRVRRMEDARLDVLSVGMLPTHYNINTLNSQSISREVSDLTWRDLDLIVERASVPQYQKGPMDVVMPLLYGLLLGFGGTLIAGVSIFLVVVYISGRNKQIRYNVCMS